jgi:hypothetical protein
MFVSDGVASLLILWVQTVRWHVGSHRTPGTLRTLRTPNWRVLSWCEQGYRQGCNGLYVWIWETIVALCRYWTHYYRMAFTRLK